MQIVFWNFISALYPVIALGHPIRASVHPREREHGDHHVRAAILGLGLNEGAYMAEIVRAGFLSVDEGQTEAAASLGMSRLQIMRHIVLPQAMRVILPPTGNETISMLKNSSLVYTIGYAELFYAVPADLRGQLRDDPAADRGQHLVPGDDERRSTSASTSSSGATAAASRAPSGSR